MRPTDNSIAQKRPRSCRGHKVPFILFGATILLNTGISVMAFKYVAQILLNELKPELKLEMR